MVGGQRKERRGALLKDVKRASALHWWGQLQLRKTRAFWFRPHEGVPGTAELWPGTPGPESSLTLGSKGALSLPHLGARRGPPGEAPGFLPSRARSGP